MCGCPGTTVCCLRQDLTIQQIVKPPNRPSLMASRNTKPPFAHRRRGDRRARVLGRSRKRSGARPSARALNQSSRTVLARERSRERSSAASSARALDLAPGQFSSARGRAVRPRGRAGNSDPVREHRVATEMSMPAAADCSASESVFLSLAQKIRTTTKHWPTGGETANLSRP